MIKNKNHSGLILIFLLTTIISIFSLTLNSYGIVLKTLCLHSIYNLKIYQFITHTFIHQSFEHLISNMVFFIFFGLKVEEYLDKKLFILTFYTSAIIGSLAQILFAIDPNIILCGASDGVSGIMGFCFCITILERNLFIFSILSLILFNTILNSITIGANGSIAHYAHLGGFLFGIYCFLFFKSHKWICQK